MMQSSLLLVLGSIYNNPKGYDRGFVARNALNAGGFISFASGTLEVALQISGISESVLLVDGNMRRWLAMVAAIVFTTVSKQASP